MREGTIPLWVVKPGDNWHEKIKAALANAQVASLLVSVRFLASKFVAEEELPTLLSAAERGLVVLQAVVTPCLFRHTNPSCFQAVNDPSKPLSGLRQYEQDLIWERVVESVLDRLDTYQPPAPPAWPEPVPEQAHHPPGTSKSQRAKEGQQCTAPQEVPRRLPKGRLLFMLAGHTRSLNAHARVSLRRAPCAFARLCQAGAVSAVKGTSPVSVERILSYDSLLWRPLVSQATHALHALSVTNPLRREQGSRLLTYNLPEPLRVVLIRALRRPPLFEGTYTEPAIQSLYRSRLSDADLATTSQTTKRALVLAEAEVTRRTVEAPLERICRMMRNTLLVAQSVELRRLYFALIAQIGASAALAVFQQALEAVG